MPHSHYLPDGNQGLKPINRHITPDILVALGQCSAYIRHYLVYIYPYAQDTAKKLQALRQGGTLNPAPEKVRHPLFASPSFSTPTICFRLNTSCCAPSSRRAFAGRSRRGVWPFAAHVYEAQAHFKAKGLEGLLPEEARPKHPHKVDAEVMKVVQRWQAEESALDAVELAARVKQRWGITVHPRTVEKALADRQKGASQAVSPTRTESGVTEWPSVTKRLRQHALGGPAPTLEGLPGLAVLLQRGVAVWMQTGWADDLRPEKNGDAAHPAATWSPVKRNHAGAGRDDAAQLRQFNRGTK